MALLTDLLSANTTDIAANSSAVSTIESPPNVHLGNVEVTASSTTHIVVTNSLITSTYNAYLFRVNAPNIGWGYSRTGSPFHIQGYSSTSGWQYPNNMTTRGRRTDGNDMNSGNDVIAGVQYAETGLYGSDKKGRIVLNVTVFNPSVVHGCSLEYTCSGPRPGGQWISSNGSGYFNNGTSNETFNSFRFFSSDSWPIGSKCSVYGIKGF